MNSLENRIEKLERLRLSADVPMIATQTETGFHWNGQTFPDEHALDAALMASGVTGRLIILD